MSDTNYFGITATRINSDSNGNPRYVVHFLNFLTEKEHKENAGNITGKYALAITKGKTIGGKKYHNKKYGGGIVFQSYNIKDTLEKIKELQQA